MHRFRRLALVLTLLAGTLPGASLALDTTREDVRTFSAEMVRKHGFDSAWVDTMLLAATSQPAIIEAMTRVSRTLHHRAAHP